MPAGGRGRGSIWPTARDMGELVVGESHPWRVSLGRLIPASDGAVTLQRLGLGGRGAILAAPSGYPVVVIGATRSGKTTSLLIPAVLAWKGPIVATSIRGDIVSYTRDQRKADGFPTLIYNPSNQGGYGSNTWSPLARVMGDKPWAAARRTARVLIEAAEAAGRNNDANVDFWNRASARYLAPLLLAAAAEGPSMEPVMQWLQQGDKARKEVSARLAEHPAALSAAKATWGLTAKLADSQYITALTALSPYEDDEVLSTCTTNAPGELPQITAASVLGTPPADDADEVPGATLYIVAPPTESSYYAPLFSALVDEVVTAAFARSGGVGPLEPPLLLALDEVANISPLKDLPDWSSMTAGAGIQLLSGLQDLGQAKTIWGPDGTTTLLSNHRVKLMLGGSTDVETLEWASKLAGEVEQTRWVETRGKGGKSRSEQVEHRPLMSAAEIRQMPKGIAMLISEDLPVALIRQKQWTTT